MSRILNVFGRQSPATATLAVLVGFVAVLVASLAPIVPAALTVVTVITFTSTPAHAQVQPPEVEWQETYGGTGIDLGLSVQQTKDGGYIVAGQTTSFGAGRWDVYLVKTGALGKLVWQQTYGGTDDDWGYSVQQTTDGGYVVAGHTASFGAGGQDIYLIKTDNQGNLDPAWGTEWPQNPKTFGGTSDDAANSVQQTTDGGYIVAGYAYLFDVSGTDVYLIKTDAQGNALPGWPKTFGGVDINVANSVQQTTDGGYIIAGRTRSFGAGDWDVYLIKTDANGNVAPGWPKTFGGAGDDKGYSVQQTSDGGYIAAGETNSFGAGAYDVYLIKTDALGSKVWQETYGGMNSDGGFSVQQTQGDGYIVAGGLFAVAGGGVYLIKLRPDQPPQPKPCSPDAEVYDEMATELSHNIEVFGLGRVCTADLTGTIGVKRYLPYVDPATGRRTMDTKITKMELTGTDPNCGDIRITLQQDQASGGKVVEKTAGTCFPADSYFDVFIQVAIPNLNLTLANCKPATMRCVVSTLPPIGCVYQLGTGFDVPLYDLAARDCATPGNPVGQISAADHRPTAAQGPPIVIPPPTRTQLNLYQTATNQWLPLTDQVRRDYFKPTLPCVVIVHGWNRQLLEGLSAWNKLATAVATRLSNQLGPQVNILAWDWMEEAKGGTSATFIATRFQQAAKHVFDQSRRLARSLQRLFQADATTRFQQPIHLIGHSLGASLVAMTGLALQDPGFGGSTYPVANVTLFDPPDRVPVINRQIINSLDRNVPLLRSFTPPTAVDCFSGTYNDLTYYSNVWYVVPEGGHDTFNWYQAHLPQAAEPTLHRRLTCDDTPLPATVGFGASQTHAPTERQLRLGVCQPAERDVSLVAHSADDNCTARDEFVFAQYCIANAATTTPLITHRLDLGIGNDACACDVPPDLDPKSTPPRVRMRLRRPGGGGAGGQEENLTATFTLPLAVAPEWDYLSCTYRIEAAPSPATFTLSIQDGDEVTPLFLATSDVDVGELVDAGLLNITGFRGKSVQLVFSLASAQPDAVVEVSRLTAWQGPFHHNLPPVANAGADQAVAVGDPLATAVTLDGSGSTDGNGDPLVYVWTVPNGIIAVGEQPTVDLPLGGYTFTLHSRDPFDGFSSDEVIVEVEHPFVRGDSNADGARNITDPIVTLTWLFLNPTTPICRDAADTNDDAVVNITDPIALLGFLFLGTAAPPPPFPDAGLDPTPDLLGCDVRQR